MRLKAQLPFLICLTYCMAFNRIHAQSISLDIISSAGVYATSSSGSMCWTIGEVMTETYTSSGNALTQGFQQPDTSFSTSVANETLVRIAIYPNPVVDRLIVNFSTNKGTNTLEILDMQGKQLRKESCPENQNEAILSFSDLADGMYILTIINNETNTRTSFKINKIQ
jgi:hypothetical protein